jgi:hypothetical protein
MPIRMIHSKAVRLNGYTDGMVVPTGSFRESGVDLFNAAHNEKQGVTNKVGVYESDSPKVGSMHIPNEGNGLNNIIGPFTIEAFVIPDRGGVIVHKPNAFTLKVGEPFSSAPAVFDLHTRTSEGKIGSERVSSVITYPQTNTDWGSYSGGESKPHDLDLPSRELLYVNAQFTGTRMRIYINTDLVADMDFGGEKRIIRSQSADLFIGGEGGEYRGIIESVRISRGVIEPKMRPFTTIPEAVGLWDFEDEDDIPQIYFFNNRNPAHPQQGKDGVGSEGEGLMPLPMVCVGYDFTTIEVSGDITSPITLKAGYDYGYFSIRDFPDSVVVGLTERPTALELLASHMLSIEVEELQLQTWWEGGVLDISSQITGANYHSDGIPVSNLNAIVNAGGTDPMTGGSVSPFGYYDSSPEGGIDLDPMVNPIERVRIVAIDFKGDAGLGRPPSVIIQNTILSGNNDPNTQGFLFEHPDNTPVWFTLGNADLVIDPGATTAVVRPKGQMTRATFTQNQRFNDKSGEGNDAYFIATKSRMSNEMLTQVQGVSGTSSAIEPPLANDLAIWLDANDKTTVLRYDGTSVVSNDDYVFWWNSKARADGTMNYHFYGWGDGWRWIQNCGKANNRSGLIAVSPSEALVSPTGPMTWQGGSPVIGGGVIVPTYPVGQQFYGGSGWVNGDSAVRANAVAGSSPVAFAIQHLANLYGGGPDMTDGDWSYYFVVTPQYTAGVPLTLMRSEINNNFNVQIDNGGTFPYVDADGMVGVGLPSTYRPTAGSPALISLRIDEGASRFAWDWRGEQGVNGIGGTGNWSPTTSLIFDDISPQRGGIDFLCEITDNAGANDIANLAPPGFIVHEILAYPLHMSDTQDADIKQWFEDKYGV